MPFTPAHPAIILPLRKSKRISFTAVTAGSIVPDFEFFFQMREVENIGHHWQGIFLLDLPLALVFCFLFHIGLRNSFLENLPQYLRARYTSYNNFNWLHYASSNKLKIITSCLLGIITHIVWDEFTHYDGFFVAFLPFLNNNFSILHFNIPVFFLLQVFFSITGMAIAGICILNKKATAIYTVTPPAQLLYWLLFFATTLLFIAVRLIFWPQYNSFWGIVMAVMGSLCYGWMLSTLFYKIQLFKRNQNGNTNQTVVHRRQ